MITTKLDWLSNDELVCQVYEKIPVNTRFAISNLALVFPEVSCTALYEIVTERLCYQKVFVWWVPNVLTENNKAKCFVGALTFLSRHNSECDKLLNYNVTGDETFISNVTPSSRQQSMEWKQASS